MTKLVNAVINMIIMRDSLQDSTDSLMASLVKQMTRVKYSKEDWSLDVVPDSEGLTLRIVPNPNSDYGKFLWDQLYTAHTKEELSK